MTETQDNFVKAYVALWGEDEVERLIDSGYWPTLVTDGTTEKWTWLQIAYERDKTKELR